MPLPGEEKKNDLLHLIGSEKPGKMSFWDTKISSGYDTLTFSPSRAQLHDTVKLQMQRLLIHFRSPKKICGTHSLSVAQLETKG